MKVCIDKKKCTGCGMCVIICPELFCLECHNPHAIAVTRREQLSEKSACFARNAALQCPANAILLKQEHHSMSKRNNLPLLV